MEERTKEEEKQDGGRRGRKTGKGVEEGKVGEEKEEGNEDKEDEDEGDFMNLNLGHL